MTTLASRFIATRQGLRTGLLAAGLWAAIGAPASAQCVGDCDDDGVVAINELILGVNIALGTQPANACAAFQDDNGMVSIAQLIKGVNNALGSCPAMGTPTATPSAGTPMATQTPT